MTAAIALLTLAQQIQSDSTQRAVGRQQAALAQAQAERERAIAAQQAADYERRQSAIVANARTRRAASGVGLSGSPLLADDAAQQEIALGAAGIRAGGAERARRLEEQGAMARWQAQAATSGGAYRYGTTLLRGLDGVSFWKDFWNEWGLN